MRRFHLCGLVVLLVSGLSLGADPTSLGRGRELFTDDYLIDRMTGDVAQFVHEPRPENVVIVTGEPWEGNTCAYYTIFQDGDKYRMYYRGSHGDVKTSKTLHEEVTCYAESTDGVTFTKPRLGLFEWNGSKENNIVWRGIGTHNFTPFKDLNPAAPEDSRYKAIASGSGVGNGLYVYASPDGLSWRMLKETPVITKGAFDSQNLAFWDPVTKQYVDYHRIFVDGVRAIMTCTSDDFVAWTDPVLLNYPGSSPEHLYTNAIRPYPRAPHIRIGFPTRFQPRNSQVEPVFMSSRDGVTFKRWDKAVIPITAPEERDGNRSNYMANGLVMLPGNNREYAVYASEAYYEGPDTRLRRFMYRVDGFVSVRGGEQGGEMITRPMRFSADNLVLNYAVRPGGSLRVEIQTPEGEPLERYTLEACEELQGDEISRTVSWKQGDGLIGLTGKPVRLRFQLKNADLYSMELRVLE